MKSGVVSLPMEWGSLLKLLFGRWDEENWFLVNKEGEIDGYIDVIRYLWLGLSRPDIAIAVHGTMGYITRIIPTFSPFFSNPLIFPQIRTS